MAVLSWNARDHDIWKGRPRVQIFNNKIGNGSGNAGHLSLSKMGICHTHVVLLGCDACFQGMPCSWGTNGKQGRAPNTTTIEMAVEYTKMQEMEMQVHLSIVVQFVGEGEWHSTSTMVNCSYSTTPLGVNGSMQQIKKKQQKYGNEGTAYQDC